jgi:hypothetical protein
MTKAVIEEETERFRQFVIAARSTDAIEKKAAQCVERLNKLYTQNREMFTAEDVRWLNVLRGFLGLRLAAHQPKAEYTRRAKRKGDTLDHCWRCETPIDERFTENCATCSDKAYQWRVCPVCQACGCQRSGRTMV